MIDQRNAGDVIGELQQKMEIRENERDGRQVLMFRDVTGGSVVISLLRVSEGLLAGDDVGRRFDFSVEYSSFSQPPERLWKFVLVDEIELRVRQLARHLLVVPHLFWHIQVVSEDGLKWWRLVVDRLQRFVKLVETVDGRDEHDEDVGVWRSIEADAGDWPALTPADVVHLKEFPID